MLKDNFLHKLRITSLHDKKLLKTILSNFLSKCISLFTSLMVVPLVLNHVGNDKYGFIITLISLLGWLFVLELGIGSSVKNLVSIKFSISENVAIKAIIINAIVILTVFVVLGILMAFFITPKINWFLIFKIKSISNYKIGNIIFFSIVFYLLNMLFSIGNNYLYGIQKGYLNNYFNIVGNSISLISIYFAVKLNFELIYIVNLYSSGFLLGNLFSFLFMIYKEKINVLIRFKYDKKLIENIFGMGTKFLSLGLITTVIYTANNILITQYIGPDKVSIFDPIMRLNQFVIQANTMLILPLWPAYTSAIARNDIEWVKAKFILSIKLILFAFLPFVLILMFFGPQIISLWLNGSSVPSLYLCILIGISTLFYLFNQSFSMLINGAGEMGKQIKYGVISILIFIFTSFLLIKKYELIGLSIAGILSSFVGLIANPFIIYKYFKNQKL